jgi:hypothetical protein
VKKTAWLLVALVGIFVAWNALPFRIAPGVTAERIRAIRPGISETDLLNSLGAPLEAKQWGTSGTLLFYARETPLVNHSATLWVYVDNGTVRQVQAKRTVMFLDDEALYLRHADMVWESPAFAKAFR